MPETLVRDNLTKHFTRLSRLHLELSQVYTGLAHEVYGDVINVESARDIRLKQIGHKTIEELEFSNRAYRILKAANINTISELATLTKIELKQMPEAGTRTVNEICEVAANIGLSLKPR